jgi:hypothetical protein
MPLAREAPPWPNPRLGFHPVNKEEVEGQYLDGTPSREGDAHGRCHHRDRQHRSGISPGYRVPPLVSRTVHDRQAWTPLRRGWASDPLQIWCRRPRLGPGPGHHPSAPRRPHGCRDRPATTARRRSGVAPPPDKACRPEIPSAH